jgi:predicted histone-like DNA-binding protein
MISLIKKKGINPQNMSTLYFPQWTRVATVSETQLAKRMARGSTFSVGEVNGVFADFPQSIIDELLNGNAVSIDGLGTFKLKVSGRSQREKKDVTSAGCRITVVFDPAAELTSRLNDEREFRFVEVPTASEPSDGLTYPISSTPTRSDGLTYPISSASTRSDDLTYPISSTPTRSEAPTYRL